MSQENNPYEGLSAEELTAKLAEKDSELAQANADKTATVGELKDLRTKKQELEQQIEEQKPKTPEAGEDTDVATAVEAHLTKTAEKEAKENRVKAVEEFRASHHEFSDAADPGGLKFAAFQKEMSKFNFEGLRSVDEVTARLKEVDGFRQRQSPDDSVNVHKGTRQSSSGGDAPTGNDKALDDVEKKLIEQQGWTAERYLALKERQPDFVEQQLQYLR